MVKITRRVIEVVITGLIRNQFESNLTWVRIPHPPPQDESANGFLPFAGSFFTVLKRGFLILTVFLFQLQRFNYYLHSTKMYFCLCC